MCESPTGNDELTDVIGQLRLHHLIEAQTVAPVAPPVGFLAHFSVEPVDQLEQLVATWAHILAHLTLAVGILSGVNDTLGHVRAVDRLLDGPLSLVPKQHSTKLTEPQMSVVAKEAICMSIDVRRTEDDGLGEILFVVLALEEHAALLGQNRLRLRGTIQARDQPDR